MNPFRFSTPTALATVLGASLVLLLVLPFVTLAFSTSVSDLRAAYEHPMFAPALKLSLGTSLASLGLTALLGTPLAWWLATTPSRVGRITEIAVQLPIIVPPAVVGVALLQTFGRRGLLGGLLSDLGVQLPFSVQAVVLAQILVSSPFFVQTATSTFRELDRDLTIVARTLGASPTEAFIRVALPAAAPGLLTGASLSCARALGEFGATLLFAGNMPGVTQTMPLAIFTALESDVRLAIVLALVLVALGAALLAAVRTFPTFASAASKS